MSTAHVLPTSNGEVGFMDILNQFEASDLQMDIGELNQVEPGRVYESLSSNPGLVQFSPDHQHHQYHQVPCYQGATTVDPTRCSPHQLTYTSQESTWDYGRISETCNADGRFSDTCHPDYPHFSVFPEIEANQHYELTSSPYGNIDSLRSTGSDMYSDSNDSVEVDQSDISRLSNPNDQLTCQVPQQHSPVCYTPHSTYPSHPQPSSRTLPNFNELSKSIKLSKRGRPVTYVRRGHSSSSDELESEEDENVRTCATSTSKGRRGAKNVLLWKFLLEMLASSERDSHDYIKWMNKEDGTFRFIDTAEISRMWGQKKKKTDMNFEKLSRGIRHYYRIGLMSRENGTRLVYKFNWDRVPKAFRV